MSQEIDEPQGDAEKLTARDGAVDAAHAAQLAELGGPLTHGAAQLVGATDAAKVASDLAQGHKVRTMDVAGAAASLTLTAGLGGPEVQAGAQAMGVASGLDAASRGGNSLKSLARDLNAPAAADTLDRVAVEERNSADPARASRLPAQERARADAEALHRIDDAGERAAAVAAMLRTALRDDDYRDALKRADPEEAEAVATASPARVVLAATKSRSADALREIERLNAEALPIPTDAMSAKEARSTVKDDLASLKRIDDDRVRQSAYVAMGHTARDQKAYRAELSRQDPGVAESAVKAFAQEERSWATKEDRKVADMDAIRRGGANVYPLVQSLDERMAKSELEERGWKDRDDLADVMRDLETLAHRDWQRAANLWEKYRPGDIDKPAFIDGDDIASPRKAAAQRNTLDKYSKSAERGEPEAKEDEFQTPESIRKRFIQAENKYYFRDDENRLAFEDRGKRMSTEHNDPHVARSMVELAKAKGWDAIKIRGTEEFKRVVWLEASLRGLEVEGYKPRAVDLSRLEELRAERKPPAERDLRNSIEERALRERDPHLGRETAAEKRAIVDEHQRSLSEPQRVAVEALKAILRERGDSEAAVKMAADIAADRFQNNRVHVGKILSHGQAPYENDPANASSYYVTLQTDKGQRTIWGVDLPRALDAAQAKLGDDVALAYQGRQPVSVRVRDKDEQGRVVGESTQAVSRNRWDVNRLESVREEVRQALTEAAKKTDRQPLIKVYDRSAPREELRPEVTREPVRRNERSR